MDSTIIRNQARCKRCNDIIESTHHHDFVWCKCKAIFVDGGTEYLRRGGNLEDIEELSIMRDKDEYGGPPWHLQKLSKCDRLVKATEPDTYVDEIADWGGGRIVMKKPAPETFVKVEVTFLPDESYTIGDAVRDTIELQEDIESKGLSAIATLVIDGKEIPL